MFAKLETDRRAALATAFVCPPLGSECSKHKRAPLTTGNGTASAASSFRSTLAICRSVPLNWHGWTSGRFCPALEWHSPMEKLDELVSQRRSPGPTRPGAWLANHCDLLALLLLVLASIPVPWLSPRTLVVVRDTDLIDDNWHLDEVFK